MIYSWSPYHPKIIKKNSPTALARGHDRDKIFVPSTYSPQIAADPPKTLFCFQINAYSNVLSANQMKLIEFCVPMGHDTGHDVWTCSITLKTRLNPFELSFHWSLLVLQCMLYPSQHFICTWNMFWYTQSLRKTSRDTYGVINTHAFQRWISSRAHMWLYWDTMEQQGLLYNQLW